MVQGCSKFEVGVCVDEIEGKRRWSFGSGLVLYGMGVFFKERNNTREKEGKKTPHRKLNAMHKTGLYVVLLMDRVFPTRNCYRMTSGLS